MTVLSFGVPLLAGVTRSTPANDRGTDRPGGMDGWIINYTVAGTGRINSGQSGFVVRPHDVLLFAPKVPHDYGPAIPARRWIHRWVYFFPRPSWTGLLSWPERGGGVLGLHLGDPAWRREVTGQLARVIALSSGAERRREDWAMNALEHVLLRLDAANPAAADLDLRVRRAMAHLGEHHRRPLRMDGVAAAVGCSPSRLAHLFRAQIGLAPMRWLEEHRIARARELLLVGGQTLAAIGAEVGLPEPAYFARVFRRRSGCSPREFRARARG